MHHAADCCILPLPLFRVPSGLFRCLKEVHMDPMLLDTDRFMQEALKVPLTSKLLREASQR